MKGKKSTTELNGPAGADTPKGPVKSDNPVESYLAEISATPYSIKLRTEQKRIVCVLQRKARLRVPRTGEPPPD
jgi:hypothetical protein